jgi:predicted choloylglycine hydrolase
MMNSIRRTGSFHGKEDEEQTTVTTLNPLFKPRAALLEVITHYDFTLNNYSYFSVLTTKLCQCLVKLFSYQKKEKHS